MLGRVGGVVEAYEFVEQFGEARQCVRNLEITSGLADSMDMLNWEKWLQRSRLKWRKYSMEKDFKIQPSTRTIVTLQTCRGELVGMVEAYEFAKQLGEVGNVLKIQGSLLGLVDSIDTLNWEKSLQRSRLKWRKYATLQVRKKGLQKEVGSSLIDIGGSVARFVSKDQDHPRHEVCYGNAVTTEKHSPNSRTPFGRK
ncbi:unnamed protein product [Dovyalis caffra]|uniref:Uncharacterized protein n=1 Tax=Dovyalis caffra TaxID=77055 RepID=A0AAV1RVB9_9ROSI|nr:unnamed protein product [Dovyalis caffra]